MNKILPSSPNTLISPNCSEDPVGNVRARLLLDNDAISQFMPQFDASGPLLLLLKLARQLITMNATAPINFVQDFEFVGMFPSF
jgi:hypothetical protein